MKQLFLYKLFKHSKWAFVFIVLFIVWYSISFYKKMDMIFFPYNNMYAVDFGKADSAITYAFKINNDPVKITDKPYWKKDLLETSLHAYALYIQHGQKVFLDDYLAYKFSDQNLHDLLLKRLTPGKNVAAEWPLWFIKAAGHTVPKSATIELMQYDFVKENGSIRLIDSISISKTTLP